jgi:hypothetical protein
MPHKIGLLLVTGANTFVIDMKAREVLNAPPTIYDEGDAYYPLFSEDRRSALYITNFYNACAISNALEDKKRNQHSGSTLQFSAGKSSTDAELSERDISILKLLRGESSKQEKFADIYAKLEDQDQKLDLSSIRSAIHQQQLCILSGQLAILSGNLPTFAYAPGKHRSGHRIEEELVIEEYNRLIGLEAPYNYFLAELAIQGKLPAAEFNIFWSLVEGKRDKGVSKSCVVLQNDVRVNSNDAIENILSFLRERGLECTARPAIIARGGCGGGECRMVDNDNKIQVDPILLGQVLAKEFGLMLAPVVEKNPQPSQGMPRAASGFGGWS